MVKEAKSGYFEEEIEIVREWIDKQDFWMLGDELDEIEGHLDTAKDLFYNFLREHNLKVGGN